MQISLTNTLTRRKEPFEPADPGRVTMYVCGPTVYNNPHIGNARPPVVFDTLYRLLRHTYGADAVIYARNFTDIDDRIIAAANAVGVPIEAITEKYAAVYEDDMAALGVITPTLRPRATQHVGAMIALIQKLIDMGAAYSVPSGVYFAVAKDADYGKLSNRAQDDLRAGARVEGEDDKRGASDFALWKAAKPGEPFWPAPFGNGRPGWHIECSAMIESVLGGTIDIHGGGLDLIFPHHENEIAQSETAHGHALARVWMHNGFLTMDATKMSKSLGNIITVRELLDEGWQGETLRWALLSAHYRAPLDWTEDLMRQAQASLDRLYQTLRDALGVAFIPWSPKELTSVDGDVARLLEPFYKALCDDLNTPLALSHLFAVSDKLRTVRNKMVHTTSATPVYDIRLPFHALLAGGNALGLLQQNPEDWFRHTRGNSGEDSAEIDALVAERVAARAAKNYAESDRLRDVLAARGVEVMDSASGSTWRRKG